MKVRYTMLNKFFAPVAMLLASVMPISAYAQNDQPSALNPPEYSVPNGPLSIYGQTLDPTAVKLDFALPWERVKDLIPGLLPQAHVEVRTKEQLCDGMVALEKRYGDMLEQIWYGLAYEIAPHFPNIKDEFLLADEVTNRLNSDDNAKFMELVAMLPGQENKVMMARDYTQKTHAIMYIRDAALHNCPDYAKQKGYLTFEEREALNKKMLEERPEEIKGPE